MANANEKIIAQAKRDYEAAKAKGDKAGMEKAHAAAEKERAKDGYSGGVDGSKKISLPSGRTYGGSSGSSSGSSGRSSGSSGKSNASYNASAPASSRYYTAVWTPEGEQVGGYIEDGKTYLNDGTRISDGYSVKAKNGTLYTMENGVGRESSVDELANSLAKKRAQNETTKAWDRMQEDYDDRMSSVISQQNAATDAGVKQAINALDKQKDTVNETMDKAAREAYIAKMQSQKGLDEQYAAAGITGGPTESGRIALENNYSNNITDINKQREASIADLDASIADARLTGDIAKAQNAANIAQQAAEKYLELAQNRIALEREVLKEADTEEEKKLQYYLTYIDAYADDPQAEIDRLSAQGVSGTDPRIMALKALMNQQKEQLRQEATELELAKVKHSSSGKGGSNGYTGTGTTAGATTSGTTGAAGSGSVLSSFPAEDQAAIRMFSQVHKGSYDMSDVTKDYNSGFLTERAYQLLKGALQGNSEYKAKVAEYSK